MKYIKKSTLLILAVLTILGNAFCQKAGETKWEVMKMSSLTVDGKTNINNFSCSIIQNEKDTLVLLKGISKEVLITGEMQMDVADFNCHNVLMTKELRKTVNANEYPTMAIHFLSLESMPLFVNKSEVINSWVEVTLAGVMKKFEVAFTFENSNQNNYKLNGSHTFLFSDFKLTPPKKFGGLVRIKNDFNVNFQLLLRKFEG